MSAVAEGHYYKKQLGCQSGVIAWSHRARFVRGLKLLGANPGRVLDYGSGDGTFLGMASPHIAEGLGADILENQVKDCQQRLAEFKNIRFCTIPELAGRGAEFDVVTCMETLEHCTAPIVQVVLKDLARLVKPTGRVIISVPIEIGPTFPFKYVIRKLAAIRGLSDYRYYESYSLKNMMKMIFATKGTKLDRPEYGDPPTHSHYGFNWRALRETVRGHLDVERTLFTPLGFLGGFVSSQAWFVCRTKK